MAIWSADSAVRTVKKLRARLGCLGGLKFLWLEITRRCNLACSHCYVESGPGLPLTDGMERHDWCRVLDDARAAGCQRVQFIGGEPTLHPDLPGLLEHASRAGFHEIEVFTNATWLREDLVRTFTRLKVLVQFSFYSSDPAVHDRVTRQAGSFDRTVAGVKQLVARRVRLSAGLIRMTDDAEDLNVTKAFLERLGVTSIVSDRVRGVGRGEHLVAGAEPRRELCGACWSGKLCVDAGGNARPCVFARDAIVGNVLDAGLLAVVNGVPLRTFRRAMFLGEQGGSTWVTNHSAGRS